MAIKEINLIPEEVVRKTCYYRHIGLWTLLFFIVQLLLFGGAAGYIQGLRPRIHPSYDLNRIHNRLGTTLEETRKIQAKIERLSGQEAFIEGLIGDYPVSTVIMELSFQITPSIWMEEISLLKGTAKEKAQLTVKGYASSHGHLGKFLDGLSQSRILKEPALGYAVEHTILSGDAENKRPVKVIRFQMDLKVGGLNP